MIFAEPTGGDDPCPDSDFDPGTCAGRTRCQTSKGWSADGIKHGAALQRALNWWSIEPFYDVWSIEDITFEIIDDLTLDPVVTVVVSTPDGTLKFMAEPVAQGATLIVRATHVQDAHANAVGHANLMVLAQALMARMNFDGLVVEGAIRTTGTNPGRRPRALRFTRRVRPAPVPRSGIP